MRMSFWREWVSSEAMDPETDPTKVDIVKASGAPLPVEVISGNTGPRMQDQRGDPSMPAQTTFQEDLTTAGQRKVNLIWEYTQAIIAIVVVVTSMVSGIIGQIKTEMQVPNLIGVAFGMITGFYFSRSNHSAIGGVGRKANADQPYVGR